MLPSYPVYIISKGRALTPLTARCLSRDGVPFRIVVEPQEAEAYAAAVGSRYVRVLPFANLGLGSIPARNWVWEDAKAEGHKWHWILDDNLRWFAYRPGGIKIQCNAGIALRATEDFIDRYENVAIAGLNYEMFAPNRERLPALVANCHVYSCLLIRNDLPFRWRGRYNEDTDLCLQALSSGLCTVLVNVFLVKKIATMKMKGGNTADLYQGDGRLKMARSLERLWPGVVETKRRFQRPQHVINWKKFDTPLRLKPGIDLSKIEPNEYGLTLTQVKPEIKSPELRRLFLESQSRTGAR